MIICYCPYQFNKNYSYIFLLKVKDSVKGITFRNISNSSVFLDVHKADEAVSAWTFCIVSESEM